MKKRDNSTWRRLNLLPSVVRTAGRADSCTLFPPAPRPRRRRDVRAVPSSNAPPPSSSIPMPPLDASSDQPRGRHSSPVPPRGTHPPPAGVCTAVSTSPASRPPPPPPSSSPSRRRLFRIVVVRIGSSSLAIATIATARAHFTNPSTARSTIAPRSRRRQRRCFRFGRRRRFSNRRR